MTLCDLVTRSIWIYMQRLFSKPSISKILHFVLKAPLLVQQRCREVTLQHWNVMRMDATPAFVKTIWQLLSITPTIRAEEFYTIQPNPLLEIKVPVPQLGKAQTQQMKIIYLESTIRHFIKPQIHINSMPRRLRIATNCMASKNVKLHTMIYLYDGAKFPTQAL